MRDAGDCAELVGFGARILRDLAEGSPGGGSLAIVLAALDDYDALTASVAGTYVARSFDSCARPSEVLERDQWVRLFRCSGFTKDWAVAAPPTDCRRLYRGAGSAGADGMCWTTSIDVARYFALRVAGGVVVTAAVGVERQLAEFAVGWEDQVVVDTGRLEIEVLERSDDLAGFSLVELRDWMDERQASWVSSRGGCRG